MTSFALVICFVSAWLLGFFHRDLKERVDDLQERMKKVEKEPEIGATMGAYKPVNEFSRVNQDGAVGLVETKTPQRIQFEAEEALRREARGER